ncbi:MAG: T9SS type A sorting domain-containing protein [Chitinophagaceae bacterium]
MKKILYCLLLFSFYNVNAQNWNGVSTVNNPVCTFSTSTQKSDLVSCKDGNGGMWIAWTDLRNSNATTPNNSDIYLQKINSDGTIAFANEGLVVCNALKSQSAPQIVEDPNGGCIIVWSDGRDSAANNATDIYIQRIAPNGMPMYTANGVPVCNTTNVQLIPVIARIDMGNVLVAWRDDRNATPFSTGQDYFCNSINISTGARNWTNDLEIVRANNTQSNMRLLTAGAGGEVFAVWQDPRIATTNTHIYAQKITATGTVSWTANGVNLNASQSNNKGNPQIISDGGSGAIIVWDDNRAANNDQGIYAQKLNSSGIEQWTAGGVLIADVAGSTNNQRNPYLTSDQSGGAIIAWQDTRNTATTGSDIYAQRVNSAGVVQWATDGVLICNAAGAQPNSTSSGFAVVGDNANGAIIIWDDARIGSSDIDIMAQRINSAGVVQWASNGIGIANRTGSNQRTLTNVLSDGSDYIIAWLDSRTATNGEIYANKLIGATGLLPLQFVQLSAVKNKENIALSWTTTNEKNVDYFEVEKVNIANTFTPIGKVVAKNVLNGTYIFEDYNLLNGKNTYRIKSFDKDGKVQYSKVLVIDLLASNNKQEINIYPNPVKNDFTIETNNIKLGKYEFRVVDMNGKLIFNKKIEFKVAKNQLTINTNNWKSGIYIGQLIDERGFSVSKNKIIKE